MKKDPPEEEANVLNSDETAMLNKNYSETSSNS